MAENPTLVLVPGSWHGPETWNRLIANLEPEKYKCIPINLPSNLSDPSTTFADDLKAVRDPIISEISQGHDVVVVVHSYGGIVGASAIKGLTKSKGEISETTGNKSGHVIGLVMIATGFVVPAKSFLDGLGGTPPPSWKADSETGLATLVGDPRELFYHDLPIEDGNYWVGKLRPQALKVLAEGGEDFHSGWLDVPVWYLSTAEDKALPIEAQRMFVQMAKDAGADVTVEEIESSHSPMLSRPKETAEFVAKAAKFLESNYTVGVIEPVSQHEGQLRRTFKARHIQMITLGGCIGSGLFISTGKALHEGGAGGMLIGYTLICIMALLVMNILTEITCIYPTPGSFIDHASRFLDPSIGFALGFTEWFAWMTVVASEAAVVRVILTYWTTSIPTAACMTVYLVLIFILHAFPNKWFAEFEFITSSLKVIIMFIILFACIAIIGGAGNGAGAHSGNYDSASAAFPNGFKGVSATFTLAAWATGGQEIMGLTAGEAHRPRYDMPRACNNLFWRILIFFDLSIIFTTLIVNKDNPDLLNSSTVAASPFVIAMEQAGIKVLPDILNAVILLGLVAIGAESMYIASRAMSASARMGLAPAILGRIDKKGRPYWALVVTGVCSTVCTYINCSNTGGIIFTWFSSISSTVYFMTWTVMAITNIQFHRAVKVQKRDFWAQPYAWKLRGFPVTAVALLILSLFVLILTGWVSGSPISGSGSAETFFETYPGVPIWFVACIGYKLIRRTKYVKPSEADLDTGRRPLSADDIAFLDEYYSQPMWKRALSYVRLG